MQYINNQLAINKLQTVKHSKQELINIARLLMAVIFEPSGNRNENYYFCKIHQIYEAEDCKH